MRAVAVSFACSVRAPYPWSYKARSGVGARGDEVAIQSASNVPAAAQGAWRSTLTFPKTQRRNARHDQLPARQSTGGDDLVCDFRHSAAAGRGAYVRYDAGKREHYRC